MTPIRNTVISRLFGASNHKKYYLSYHITQKAVWHEKTGGFFAWIAGREAKNNYRNLTPKFMQLSQKGG